MQHTRATLPQIVRAFKSLSAIAVNRNLGRSGAVWQRSYYERFVRNESELSRFRRYIIENPQRLDHDHPYLRDREQATPRSQAEPLT